MFNFWFYIKFINNVLIIKTYTLLILIIVKDLFYESQDKLLREMFINIVSF